MPITIYPGSMKKRNANGSYSDLVPAIGTDPEVLDDFAEEYDPTATYNIGDYCIHNSDFYKCNTNDTTGTWNNNAWDRVTVGDELGDHKNTLNFKADQSDLTSLNLTGTTNPLDSQIDARTYFYLNGTLVKAKVDIASGAPFTDGTNYEAVTVGEELTALNNATIVKTIPLTAQAGITVHGSISCFQYGRVCFISLNNITFANNGLGQALITGCPLPIAQVSFNKPNSATVGESAAIQNNSAYINNSNRVIFFNIGSNNTIGHWMNAAYITAE